MTDITTNPDSTAGLPASADMEALIQQALDTARTLGASGAEAGLAFDCGLSVNVRKGEVDTLEHHRDRGLSVTVYFGQRKGSANTADFRPESIRETVQAACDIARYTSEDPAHGLADPERMPRSLPDLDLEHPWALTPEEAIELARRCEAAGLAEKGITNSEGAGVSSHHALKVYGNSHGFIGHYAGTRHSMNCVMVAGEGDHMQRDYWYTVDRAPEALERAEEVGREAARRTLARMGARRLGTQRVPVLFSPQMARGLIGHFIGAIRGGALYRKASFLLDQLGQPVFPDFVQMREEPHRPRGLGSVPFDNEGVATRERTLVRDGVLQGYVLDSYSARRLGMETTGNAGGVHNLVVEPGPEDQAALLRRMGTGLLVTEMMGHGVNPVTGDYSRGATGFWVEGGEIAYPVQEITVAGNLRDMYAGLAAVGSDVDRRGNIHTGSLLVDAMTVAGE